MKQKPRVINVMKMVGEGLSNSVLPSFLTIGQRHFEKEKPSGTVMGSDRGFILPVDLLALTLPVGLVQEIESVEMVYREKSGDGGKVNNA